MQFTIIDIISLIKIIFYIRHKCMGRNGYDRLLCQVIDLSDKMAHERVEVPDNGECYQPLMEQAAWAHGRSCS